MEEIINATPHEIVIINLNEVEHIPSMRKYVIKENIRRPVVAIIPKSDIILSVKFNNIDSDPLYFDNKTIPTKKRTVVSLDPVPDDGNYYIVSALYASSITDPSIRSRLLTIGDPVYSRDGKTVLGCLFLNRLE